ncbi:50S ribosomal protein L1 [Candidatus Woesearchaeota archaeon]|nr:50S ribosomal protein L1 [Candidatus Woesearchaeota archaeon]
MHKDQIVKSIQEAREKARKRNFKQTFDLVINLKNMDLKRPEHKVEIFATLPKGRGKSNKVCALVGQELVTQAKKVCDKVILDEEFAEIAGNKKALKDLVNQFDFFIAQANIMTKVAGAFGKVLGPRGKMPNPKAGAIVSPKAEIEMVYKKLQGTVKLATRNELSIKCPIGIEDMDNNDIAENVEYVYNLVLHALPQEKQNIADVSIKLTMGSPVNLGGAKND